MFTISHIGKQITELLSHHSILSLEQQNGTVWRYGILSQG